MGHYSLVTPHSNSRSCPYLTSLLGSHVAKPLLACSRRLVKPEALPAQRPFPLARPTQGQPPQDTRLVLGGATQDEAGQGGAKHSFKRSGSAEPVALMWHKALHLCGMQIRHSINA